ncbi:glycosyltransferase family 2 protein [Paraburkholderia lycopersici]|uniref:Glycosyl transferase family 2 n=1 Tax=Paraburkholderia lycopersici TaxID=416944 RepID=A0A1G6T6P7_9BURK|nr:glycosyltransferase [Paraburkholderia lycopersici]SDD24544.1 Glycosyl transferase family 2 [Paraburkholderia lycopersici]
MASVTVLIAARNAERTLAETLESLANQTFRDFGVVLVNDASTDSTVDIAHRFRSRLNVEILSPERHLGISGAANAGLRIIESRYVARIDADDIAMPTRLEKQVAFLEANPGIDALGTAMELFYEQPGRESRVLIKPEDDASIKTALVQYCAVSNGSAMFRKSFFDDVGTYDTRLAAAEDYDVWCRGALLGKRYANLPESLTRYRQHDASTSAQKYQLQQELDLQVKRKYIGALLGGESSGNLAEFFSLLTRFTNREIAEVVVRQSMQLLFKLSRKVPNEALFSSIVADCLRRHLSPA